MDMLESVKASIEHAGIEDVYSRLADAAKHDEFTVLSFGAPSAPDVYFDQTMDLAARITVVCLRRSDLQAQIDSLAAFDALRDHPPYSLDGSYILEEMDMTLPAPVTWDAAGRIAWAFDITLTFERKES